MYGVLRVMCRVKKGLNRFVRMLAVLCMAGVCGAYGGGRGIG